jgi:hypothetical protein
MENGRTILMKRPPKPLRSQFTLPLYQPAPLAINPSSKEELLNVLAELLREALNGGQGPNDQQKDHPDESKNHA